MSSVQRRRALTEAYVSNALVRILEVLRLHSHTVGDHVLLLLVMLVLVTSCRRRRHLTTSVVHAALIVEQRLQCAILL